MSGVGLIIPAAGSGARLHGTEEKALVSLRDRPLLAWTLLAFDHVTDIVERVLVVPPGREKVFQERVVAPLNLDYSVHIVSGGEERQDSVGKGLAALSDRARWVLVHDAARPLVSPELIQRVLDALKEGESVVPALPLRDSVARKGFENWIKTYEDRSRLLSIQTPQGFHAQILDHAFQRARAEHFHGTDEASLVLRLDHPVTWTAGDVENIKITYPEDLTLAETILARRDAERVS